MPSVCMSSSTYAHPQHSFSAALCTVVNGSTSHSHVTANRTLKNIIHMPSSISRHMSRLRSDCEVTGANGGAGEGSCQLGALWHTPLGLQHNLGLVVVQRVRELEHRRGGQVAEQVSHAHEHSLSSPRGHAHKKAQG